MSSKGQLTEVAAAAFAFAAAVALILALTWPWALHFQGEFLPHWDPPFHAWKLEFMARRMLAGEILPIPANTNMLYPHSGALYFEALQWPMAIFAAPLFAMTGLPSEAIYHITLIFFWALSAPCMFFLLREMGCKKAASVAGSLVFCILPYRMSYMVEFQMEMVFAMPLFYGFFIRLFRTGSPADAVFTALAWWLLAVSEFYEAVFVAMSVPFLALVFTAYAPQNVFTRKFLIAVTAGIAVGASLSLATLLPYATLHSGGDVHRPLSEVARHCVQPFSFLIPYGRLQPWTANARRDEFSLYPTIAVMAFAAAGAAYGFIRDASRRRSRPATFILAVLAAGSFCAFYCLCGAIQCRVLAPTQRTLHLLSSASRFLVFAPSAYALVHNEGESPRTAFLKALFAASILFTFLSFGPNISFGAPGHIIAERSNKVFLFCHNTALPFLSGLRVVSRFAIVGLMFLVCLASAALDKASEFLSREGLKAAIPILSAAFVALVSIEAIPPAQATRTYRPVDKPRESPAIKWLLETHPIATMAVAPCGPRDIEGMRMFSLLKGDWPYIYVWGGYFPEYSRFLASTFMSLDPQAIHSELSRLYPDCMVIVDRSIPAAPRRGIVPKAFAKAKSKRRLIDYEKVYAGFTVEVASDRRFSVRKLLAAPPSPSPSKIFRSDIAAINPNMSCHVEGEAGLEVDLALNGHEIWSGKIPAGGSLEFGFRIPSSMLNDRPFNEFSASAHDGVCAISDFGLRADDCRYIDVCAPYTPYAKGK